MPKTIPPETYKRMGQQFKRIKSTSQSQFVTWVTSFYDSAYHDGWNECMDSFTANHGGISISEDVEDQVEIFDTDALMSVLLSVKGIGEKRAAEVINRITEGDQLHD